MGILKLYRGKELSLNKTPESEEINLTFNKGDIAIDCGANVGLVTDHFQNAGLKVYSFEPNLHAYNILEKRFRNNSNVFCLPKGVTSNSKAGPAKLFFHQEANKDHVLYSTGSSTASDKNNINKDNFVVVEMVGISNFIKNLNQPVKIIKIDVEGTEADVLNDLFDSGLIYEIEHILVETHEKKVPSSREPLRLLRERIEKENLKNVHLDWV